MPIIGTETMMAMSLSLIARSAFLEDGQGESLAQRCFSASKAAYDLGRFDGCDDGWLRGKHGERASNETREKGDRNG